MLNKLSFTKSKTGQGLIIFVVSLAIYCSSISFGLPSTAVGVLGLGAIFAICLKPVAGVIIMAFLYPLTVIGSIGHTLLEVYRYLALILVVILMSSSIAFKRRIYLGNIKWFYFMTICGSLLALVYTGDLLDVQTLRNGIMRYVMYFGFFLIIYNLIQRSGQIKLFIYFYLVSVTAISVMALVQFFWGIQFLYEPMERFARDEVVRLFVGEGIYGNHVVMLYFFSIPIVINSLAVCRSRNIAVIMLLLLAIYMLPLLLAQSRSAILGLVVGQGIVFTQMYKQRWFTWRLLSYTLFPATLYLLFVNFGQYMLTGRFSLAGIQQSVVETGRIDVLLASAKLAIDYPFGVGPDYVQLVDYGFSMSPHNNFLKVLCEVGWLGFIGYVGLTIVPIYVLWKNQPLKGDSDIEIMRLSLISGLIAYLIHNLFHNMLWDYTFWMFVPISMCVYRIILRQRLVERGVIKKSVV